MVKNVPLGKYTPGDSFIHKLDPRIKIIASIMIFFIIFFSYTYLSVFLILSYVMLLAYKSRISFKKYLRSTKSILIVAVFTACLNLFFELETSFISTGHFLVKPIVLKNSLLIFFRLFIMVNISAVLMFTTSSQNFAFALESILSPLRYLKINPHEISLTISIALKFIPILFDETNKIMVAQKARGVNFKNKNIFKQIKAYSSVFIPILVSAFKKSEDLAISMDCRCYDSSKKRTKLKTLKIKKYDIMFLVLSVIFFAGVVLCNNLINF